MKCDVTFTVDAIVGQLESSGAATPVGAHCVLAIVSAESLIILALIHIYRGTKKTQRGDHEHIHTTTIEPKISLTHLCKVWCRH